MKVAERKGNPDAIKHYDFPNRIPATNGVPFWKGTLSLIRKIDDGYQIVATFKYSFEVHKNGNTYVKPLEFNPNIDKSSDEYKHHIDKLNEFYNKK